MVTWISRGSVGCMRPQYSDGELVSSSLSSIAGVPGNLVARASGGINAAFTIALSVDSLGDVAFDDAADAGEADVVGVACPSFVLALHPPSAAPTARVSTITTHLRIDEPYTCPGERRGRQRRLAV